jgi:hypothetical protein
MAAFHDPLATAHTLIGGIARERYVDVIFRWIARLIPLSDRHKRRSKDALGGHLVPLHSDYDSLKSTLRRIEVTRWSLRHGHLLL